MVLQQVDLVDAFFIDYQVRWISATTGRMSAGV